MRINVKSVNREAVDFVNEITPSVLVVARIAKITPADLAKALYDRDSNEDYLNSVLVNALPLALKRARAEAKEAKADNA